MNFDVMKFKNYVWPHNPSSIEVSVNRDLKDVMIPFYGSAIQDFGREKRVVSGYGQFFGADCFEQFNVLFSVFKQGGAGYLSLPGLDAFLAVFKRLELVGNSTPNVLNYSFEFWEDVVSPVGNSELHDEFYTVLAGDSLWSIAAKFDVPVETLLELNPSIKNPKQLAVGKKVKLR